MNSDIKNSGLILYMLPAMSAGVFVQLGGLFSVGELLFALIGVFVLIGRRYPSLLNIFLFLAFFQLLSDVYNQTDLLSMMKGVGAYLLIFLCSLGIYRAASTLDARDVLKLIFITLVSLAAGIFFMRISDGMASVWKSYFAFLVTISGLIFIYNSRNIDRRTSYMLLLVLVSAAFSVQSNYRAAAGVAIVAIVVSNFSSLFFFVKRLSAVQLTAVLCASLIILNFIATEVFRILMEMGVFEYLLDEENLSKYAAQIGGTYGILVGGRPEFVAALDAFFDRPLFGYGSWAIDETGIYNERLAIFRLFQGYSDYDLESSFIYIPTHSHVLQGFVWGGLVSGLMWLYLLALLIKTASAICCAADRQLRILICYVLAALVWNVIFSPFGYISRFSLAILFVVIIYFSPKKHEKNEN